MNYKKTGRTEKAIKTYEQLLEMMTKDRRMSPINLSIGRYNTLVPVLEH